MHGRLLTVGLAATSAGWVGPAATRSSTFASTLDGAEETIAVDDEHALETEVGARCTSWEATSPPASSTSGANGLGVAWGSTTAGEGWVSERVAGGIDDGDDDDDSGSAAAGTAAAGAG